MTSLLGCSGEDFGSVLRSLGYRPHLEKPPQDAAEAIAPNADAVASEGQAEPTAPADTAPEPDARAAEEIAAAPPATDTTEASPPVPPTETGSAEADTAASEVPADAAPPPPEMVEVWRWHRQDKPRARRQHQAPRRHASQAVPPAGPEAEKRPPRPHRKPRSIQGPRSDVPPRNARFKEPPAKPEKAPDPNSPFAALAALKAMLEGKAD
jgi:ATP-dependent RNA helicase SUPV3L1/SUV3